MKIQHFSGLEGSKGIISAAEPHAWWQLYLIGWLAVQNKQTIKHTHHTRVGPQPVLSTLLSTPFSTLLCILLTSSSLRLRCELLCSLGDFYHLTFFSYIIFSDNVKDSSSSKYISIRRVLLSVSTSGVLMKESLSPASSSWMTTAPTIQLFRTGSMLSLAVASIQSSWVGLVRGGPAMPADHLLQQEWGRAWGEAEGWPGPHCQVLGAGRYWQVPGVRPECGWSRGCKGSHGGS